VQEVKNAVNAPTQRFPRAVLCSQRSVPEISFCEMINTLMYSGIIGILQTTP
jgi:hypothetical protein